MAAFDSKTAALTLNNDVPEVARPFQIQDLENLYNLLCTLFAVPDQRPPYLYSEPAVITGGLIVSESANDVTLGPTLFTYNGELYINTKPITVSKGSLYGLCLVKLPTDNRVFGDGVTRPFAYMGSVVAVPENGAEPEGFVKRLGVPDRNKVLSWQVDRWRDKTISGSTIMRESITESRIVANGITGAALSGYLIPAVVTSGEYTVLWGSAVGLGDILRTVPTYPNGMSVKVYEMNSIYVTKPPSGSTAYVFDFDASEVKSIGSPAPLIVNVIIHMSHIYETGLNKIVRIKTREPNSGASVFTRLPLANSPQYENGGLLVVTLAYTKGAYVVSSYCLSDITS